MLKRILHDKKGVAMEWAIVFGLVIFAIIGLILSMMTTFRVNTKLAQKSDQRRNDLNQIGEYFVRAVGSKSEFLNGDGFTKAKLQNLNQSNYPWLDTEAITFFDRCNTDYGYTYDSQYAEENQGTFWNFYRDEGRSRKLTVKSGSNKVLSIVIAENITYDESRPLILTSSYNPETSFEILEWTVNDEIDDLGGDKANFLQRIWQWIGGIFGRVEVSTKTCTVTYDYNSAVSGKESTFSQYPQGSQITLPTPTADGYSFLNWSDSNGKTYAGNSSYKVSGNIKFTANWKEYTGPNYSIVFHKNDGTNATDTENNIKSNTYNISGNRNFERNGYNFKGWSASSSGNAISSPYTFTGGTNQSVDLYALWETATYNITCNGTNVGSYTYKPNDSQTVTVNYTAATGKTYAISTTTKGSINSGDSKKIDIPAGTYGNISVTITESWVYYTISPSGTSTYGGKYELIDHTDEKEHYGEIVSFTASADKGVDSVTVKAANGDREYTVTNSNGTYSFTMPDCDVKIRVIGKEKESGGGGCFASGTLITMADGTKKKIEDVAITDKVLAYNHETGEVVSANINFIEADGWNDYKIINLVWSNGQISKIIYEHGFFDLDMMKYVYIHADDYGQYLGHRFYAGNLVDGTYTDGEVTLVKAYITNEYVGCYSFPTVYHLNMFMDDMLSMPGGITGTFNIFDYDENLKYNKEDMVESIEKFGLLDYEFFAEYMDYETYCKYPSKYLNVSIGKELMDENDLRYLIERYAKRYAGSGF